MIASCHFRSTSMPSQSHPLVLKVDEELNRLRGWQSSTSSASVAEILTSSFDNLNKVYSIIQDLLRLPLINKQSLSSADKKWVNDMLDDSLRLLDICCTIRNLLIQMKEPLHDLQWGFRNRRGGGELGVGSTIEAYLKSRKKTKKEISKCLGILKTMETRSVSFPTMTSSSDQNQDEASVVNSLRDLRSISITIFCNLALFVSGDTRQKSGTRRWNFVISSMLGNSRMACEGEEGINEMGSVDFAIHALHTCRSSKVAKEIQVQNAQRQLESLETCSKNLEIGLECMFRHLVQTRVSLLNLLAQ